MKVLITGASGLLGSKLMKEFRREGFRVIGTYSKTKAIGLVRLDITDAQKVKDTLLKHNPDAVVHTAALTNVDSCEKNPSLAMKVNGEGTANVAMAAERVGAFFIYISTDYVFDGKRGNYEIHDTPNPINIYGRSKLEGENVVKETCSMWAIGRVSALYGWPGPNNKMNFTTWLIESLRKERRVRLLTDQYVSPTLADRAAGHILTILKNGENGIFHICGSGCLSRYEFGVMVADIFALRKELIDIAVSKDMGWLAKRPMRCCLSIDRSSKVLGVRFPPIKEDLMLMRSLE